VLTVRVSPNPRERVVCVYMNSERRKDKIVQKLSFAVCSCDQCISAALCLAIVVQNRACMVAERPFSLGESP
jgi:hypothetical protein